MLCYPDDFEDSNKSLAEECLKAYAAPYYTRRHRFLSLYSSIHVLVRFRSYTGDTVIVVGEHFGQTYQDNPWSVSCTESSQVALVRVALYPPETMY